MNNAAAAETVQDTGAKAVSVVQTFAGMPIGGGQEKLVVCPQAA